MHNEICQVLIPKLLQDWTGALISRSRVVDGLLDLRSAAASDVDLLIVIDKALATIPGQNLVEAKWAIDVLANISDLASSATLVP
jgi:hypothetical protein